MGYEGWLKVYWDDLVEEFLEGNEQFEDFLNGKYEEYKKRHLE